MIHKNKISESKHQRKLNILTSRAVAMSFESVDMLSKNELSLEYKKQFVVVTLVN